MIASSDMHAAASDAMPQAGYAPVNGLQLYYEIHGAGEPLVLLHGGLDTIETVWSHLLSPLAETRRVIAVELQGHGHTADIDRPLRYETMADDVAALIRYLELEHADVFGFSLGGGVALQVAIRHPEVVRKLTVASAPFRSDGWFEEIREGTRALTGEAMVSTPWYDAYQRVAPQPEQWAKLVPRVGQLVGGSEYDWTEALRELSIPVLILVGDADSVSPAHAVELYELLGGGQRDGGTFGLPQSQLAILPATMHLTMLARVDLLLPILAAFLGATNEQETQG